MGAFAYGNKKMALNAATNKKKGFLAHSFDHGTSWTRMCWVCLGLLIAVAGLAEAINMPLYETHEGTVLLAGWLIFVAAIAKPVSRMGHAGHQFVVYVVIWSILTLAVTLAVFYVAFFVVTSNWAIDHTAVIDYATLPKVDTARLSEIRTQWQPVLSLPPVLLGVWSGLTGLYVHYQTQKKNQRTSNAFAIVMQTRTNTAFLDMSRARTAAFKPNFEIPHSDLRFFKASAATVDLEKMRTECATLRKVLSEMACGVITDQARLGKKNELEKRLKSTSEDLRQYEGAAGLRYLLNFYEFMAKGIRAGDLDEDLIRGTLRGTVVACYNDGKHLRALARNGVQTQGPDFAPPQPAAFEHLDWLVIRENEPGGWSS
jgi:hypothetical protein